MCPVCHGTSNGLVRQGDSEDRYALYKYLYTNCTYLLGNLEIVFLDTPYKIFDLSFLSTIKQVRKSEVANLLSLLPSLLKTSATGR